MTKDELYRILGHQDIQKDIDIKTLVLDVIRERLSQEEISSLFWGYLENMDEGFIRGYFYRRF